MTVYTKEEFKRLWDGDDRGGGITYEDLADCSVAWGLYARPMINPIDQVKASVLEAAGCET